MKESCKKKTIRGEDEKNLINKEKRGKKMSEIKLNVNGMVCGGCEKRVINALSDINGIQEVVADHNKGTVTIKANENIEKIIIKEKIEELGFEVKEN